MQGGAQGRAAPGEAAAGLGALVEDVEAKRHRRNPFGDRYVALATSEFGAGGGEEVGLPAAAGALGRGRRAHGGRAPAAAKPSHTDRMQDGGRAAVEAATTNVHVRVEVRVPAQPAGHAEAEAPVSAPRRALSPACCSHVRPLPLSPPCS